MPITLPVQVLPFVIQDGPNKKVVYPQVTYPQNRQFEYVMNQKFVQETQKLINEQAAEIPSTVVEMIGYFEMKNNQREVLSVALSNYTYHDKAAHGVTQLRSLTFDLKSEKLCKLEDLFKPGVNYINRLSELIRGQIKKREVPLLGEFTKIDPDQFFYIADKTLVIYYQPYELTPGVYGFPMFPISVYDLQDIIKEDGPLGRMATND